MGSVHAPATADDKALALFGKTFISTVRQTKRRERKLLMINPSRGATSQWQVSSRAEVKDDKVEP